MPTLQSVIVPTLELKDGTHKIRIAIYHKHQTRYIPTRFIIEKKNFKDGRVIGREDATIINRKLRVIINEYEDALDKIAVEVFTCTQLKDYLLNIRSSGISIVERWEEYITELNDDNRKGTAGLHDITKRYFEEKFDNMSFEALTPGTVKEFDKFLYKVKGLGDTSVSMHMKRFKTLVNTAKKENIIRYEIEPFAYYSMPEVQERELDITIDELKRIRDLETTRREFIISRDLFMLSYYLGGINLIDLMDIDFKKNCEIIEYIRKKSETTKKGDKRISITIPDEAKPIIQRYIGKKGRLEFGYNFKDYNDFRVYVTRYIHKVAEAARVHKRVVYYSARKSFVQHGFELGIPLEVLEYTIGQSMKRNRPIFSYVKMMRKHADVAIRVILDNLL